MLNYKTEGNLQELRLDKDFLDMPPKSTTHKRKKIKWTSPK